MLRPCLTPVPATHDAPGVISNIQALRAFAAVAVVYYHAPFKVFGVESSFVGVAVFFCISGFVMTLISRRDDPHFLVRRIVRIVPAYWIATLVLFFAAHLGLLNPARTLPILAEAFGTSPGLVWDWIAANHGLSDPAAARGLVKSLLFIPYDHGGAVWPVLGVGWSLNLEIAFYVLFAAALAVSRRHAPAIVALVIVASAAVLNALPVRPETAFYGRAVVLCFVSGIACHYAWRRIPEAAYRRNRRLVVAMTVALYGLFFAACALTPRGSPRLAVLEQLVPPVVVFCALACHSAGARVTWRPVLFLGEASYSIYLVHLILITALDPAARKLPLETLLHAPLGSAAVVGACVLAAAAFYVWIERPLVRSLNARLRRAAERRRAGAAEVGRAAPAS